MSDISPEAREAAEIPLQPCSECGRLNAQRNAECRICSASFVVTAEARQAALAEIAEASQWKAGETRTTEPGADVQRAITRALDAQTKELAQAKAALRQAGICETCFTRYVHDITEPFASCDCGTTEWAFQDIKKAPLSIQFDAVSKELARLREENEKLKAFKAYVHKRLDDAGIPVDPESTHKAEGCRVGGRLDIALSLRAENERLTRERDDANRKLAIVERAVVIAEQINEAQTEKQVELSASFNEMMAHILHDQAEAKCEQLQCENRRLGEQIIRDCDEMNALVARIATLEQQARERGTALERVLSFSDTTRGTAISAPLLLQHINEIASKSLAATAATNEGGSEG